MKKKIAVLIVLAALLATAVPTAAYADMGPKPSVRIAFAQMGEELCYATLLSKTPSTGPASAWNGEEEDIRYGDLEPEIWRAFVGYRDEDGFYFLQTARRCDETKDVLSAADLQSAPLLSRDGYLRRERHLRALCVPQLFYGKRGAYGSLRSPESGKEL